MTELPVELELASPLTLLMEEERYRDKQAEEALFLSFTTDLDFFETVALGATHRCGARVTLVGRGTPKPCAASAIRRAAFSDSVFEPRAMPAEERNGNWLSMQLVIPAQAEISFLVRGFAKTARFQLSLE